MMRRSMQCLQVAAVLLGFCSSMQAQVVRAEEFDVATVKAVVLAPLHPININLGTILNGRVSLSNVTLSDCIKFAYEVVSDAQISGPEWINSGSVRFDIVGQAAPNTSRERLLLMVQRLLLERLNVVLHKESRDLPFLALTVAKNGSRLSRASELEDASTEPGVTRVTFAGRIVHERMPMSLLVTLLSRFERQTVLDLTNLPGAYSVDLRWTPESQRLLVTVPGTPSPGEAATVDRPTLFTAVQEQLGLRLDARRGPVQVWVVDSADKVPVDN